GLGGPARLEQGAAEVGVGLGVGGPEGQGLPPVYKGLRRTAGLVEEVGQIVVGLRQVGPEAGRLVEAGGGPRPPAPGGEGGAPAGRGGGARGGRGGRGRRPWVRPGPASAFRAGRPWRPTGLRVGAWVAGSDPGRGQRGDFREFFLRVGRRRRLRGAGFPVLGV